MGLVMVGCGDSGSGGGCNSGEVPCDDVCIPAIELTLEGTTGSQQAGLELSSVDVSAANLIDIDATQIQGKRVTPSDSSASYIMNKLLGENIATDTLMMPITGTLCDEKRNAVRDWINAGALVN